MGKINFIEDIFKLITYKVKMKKMGGSHGNNF